MGILKSCKNKIFMKKCCFIFLCVMIFFSLLSWQLIWPPLTSAEMVWEDFKKDAMTSWNTILNEYKKGVEVEICLTKPDGEVKITLALKENMEKELYHDAAKKGSLLDVRNSEYQFSLNRASDNTSWSINKLFYLSERKNSSQYFNDLLPLTSLFFEPLMIEG